VSDSAIKRLLTLIMNLTGFSSENNMQFESMIAFIAD
jgi:hypothetical protein